MSNGTAGDLPNGVRTSIEPGRRKHLKRVIFIGLCAVIAVAPAVLAAVQPLAWETAGLCIALLLMMDLLRPIDEQRLISKYLFGPGLLFVAVVAFVIVQIMPLVPDAWQNPVWSLASEAPVSYTHLTLPTIYS